GHGVSFGVASLSASVLFVVGTGTALGTCSVSSGSTVLKFWPGSARTPVPSGVVWPSITTAWSPVQRYSWSLMALLNCEYLDDIDFDDREDLRDLPAEVAGEHRVDGDVGTGEVGARSLAPRKDGPGAGVRAEPSECRCLGPSVAVGLNPRGQPVDELVGPEASVLALRTDPAVVADQRELVRTG